MSHRCLQLILVLAAVTGCGGGSELESPDTPRSPLPPELAGAWYTGSLSSLQYYDQDTGEWQNPSGEGFYFIFDDDGDYETGAVISSIVAGCEMRLLGAEVGTAVRGGDALTLHRHWVTTRVTNSCGDDGERTQGQATSEVTWWVELDDDGRAWLSLAHADGSVERYRRWQD